MWKRIKQFIFIVLVLNVVFIIWGRFFNPPITLTQIGGLFEYGKLHRDYISYDEMGNNVKKAVIASEDQKFFDHDGFDYTAIEKAMKYNEKGKKNKRRKYHFSADSKKCLSLAGQKLGKKRPGSSYTFIIEKVWSKDIILERYLNSIEMGQGVFGVEAAAQYYFGKSSKDLTASDAAWIAAVLPNPKKYDPKNPSPYLRKKHNWIMRQMRNVSLK
jgi:monofunctional biosynthetic peptidoglycan transglycosylase